MKKIKLKELKNFIDNYVEDEGEDAYFYVYTNMGVIDWWWFVSEEDFLEKGGGLILPAFDEDGKDIAALMLEDRAARLARAKEFVQEFIKLLNIRKASQQTRAYIKELIKRTKKKQEDIELEEYDDQELLLDEFKQLLEVYARKRIVQEWKSEIDECEKAILSKGVERRRKLKESK